MSGPRLPAELLDHIADLLRDRETLESCCLVSKSWIPRARKHLFACVAFHTADDLRSWKNEFPDPSASPACYAKSLVMKYYPVVTTADVEEGGWISTFSRVEDFELDLFTVQATGNRFTPSSLVPFHGFSPVLTSLCVMFSTFPSSCISNLIQSFPLLEDLSLLNHDVSYSGDCSDRQSGAAPLPTSPPFTGSLALSLRPSMSPIVPRLLSPSYDLRFRRLHLAWFHKQDVSLTAELVERCGSALEFLHIDCLVGKSLAGSIDLSKAKKLQDAEFGCRVYPPLITATLRTITDDHRNLRRIALDMLDVLIVPYPNYSDPTSFVRAIGATHGEWLELDRVLARLWRAHSIHVKVLYNAPASMDGKISRGCVESLLPELMKKGVVDLTRRE